MLTEVEIDLILTLFSPDFIWRRASTYAAGTTPVLGAQTALDDSKAMLSEILDRAAERARKNDVPEKTIEQDNEFFRAGMFWVEKPQDLKALISPHRELMVAAHPGFDPWQMKADLPPITLKESYPADWIRLCVLRAFGEMLQGDPSFNRALLPPFGPGAQVFQRCSPEIVMPVEYRMDDLDVLLIDPMVEDLPGHLKDKFKRFLKSRKHRLYPRAMLMVRRWLQKGFLGSYGGAFISDAGLMRVGKADPIFIPANGIPISAVINPASTEKPLILTLTIDHRVFDASHGERMHDFLYQHLSQELS